MTPVRSLTWLKYLCVLTCVCMHVPGYGSSMPVLFISSSHAGWAFEPKARWCPRQKPVWRVTLFIFSNLTRSHTSTHPSFSACCSPKLLSKNTTCLLRDLILTHCSLPGEPMRVCGRKSERETCCLTFWGGEVYWGWSEFREKHTHTVSKQEAIRLNLALQV